jgi:hypothetical protein
MPSVGYTPKGKHVLGDEERFGERRMVLKNVKAGESHTHE